MTPHAPSPRASCSTFDEHGVPSRNCVYPPAEDPRLDVASHPVCEPANPNRAGTSLRAFLIFLLSSYQRGQCRPRLHGLGSPMHALQALCHLPTTSSVGTEERSLSLQACANRR